MATPTGSRLHSSTLKRRLRYYVPSTAWIPNYSFSLFGGDFLAGATVASVLIPQSVSYATSLANLSPPAGLFSASIPGIIYAFLGTSRQLNVAPEASLSLMVGQVVREMQHNYPASGDPEGHSTAVAIAVSTVITFQVGLFTFLLGFLRLGFIDVVLSRALLRGFITAIALVISIEQLIPMFGLTALEHRLHPSTSVDKLLFLVKHMFTNYNERTTMISFTALLALVSIRWGKSYFRKYWFIYRMPEVLIVVIAFTFLSGEFGWDKEGVDILGSVQIVTGMSFIRFPLGRSNAKFVRATTATSIVVSIVGYLDSVVSAKQNSARFGYSISPNRELVALGAANLASSLVPGTLPAFGSITRSRINADVGGRTQMASLVCSALVLFATFFLLPLLYYLPKCVLAAIICLVIFSLLAETPHDVVYFWRLRAWADLGLMLLTFAGSFFWSLETGIIASLICSLMLVVHRASKTQMTILGRIPGTDRWQPLNENPEAQETIEGVLIVSIRENTLDFANTAQLKERLRRLELYGVDRMHPSEDPQRSPASSLVFHMLDVAECDAQATQIFYELLVEYKNRGVGLYLTNLRSKPMKVFEKAGIVDFLGAEAFYTDIAYAIASIEGSSFVS
ncbi:sulfate anion transporter [Fistulina hepatica ATCC 64428]|uniref:Sulfate anion transporter n=1 Tax=Fistulina hepatica ATCC 64428 TaxID=1128425 RepID=A0A0D7AKZ7_9AGAR|nr:sulfate anion transporter [Fistulina hepatica ATCC 64428]